MSVFDFDDDTVYVPAGEYPPAGYDVLIGRGYGGGCDRWARTDPATGLLMVYRRGYSTDVTPRGYELVARDEVRGPNGADILAPTSTAHLWQAAFWLRFRLERWTMRLGYFVLGVGCRLSRVRVPYAFSLGEAFVKAYHLCEERERDGQEARRAAARSSSATPRPPLTRLTL